MNFEPTHDSPYNESANTADHQSKKSYSAFNIASRIVFCAVGLCIFNVVVNLVHRVAFLFLKFILNVTKLYSRSVYTDCVIVCSHETNNQ